MDPQVARLFLRYHYLLYLLGMLIVAALVTLVQALRGFGSKKWPTVEAVVTAIPFRSGIFIYHAVRIEYEYLFEGIRYTGRHSEPVSIPGDNEFSERYPKGRRFILRVKPGKPEVSVILDDDQPDGILQRLERIDEERKRGALRS